jgi:NAD(P)-dependent dehydrogenase (short-subunit alcohol dehydrogenase family)
VQKECQEAGVKAVLIKADMTNTDEARRAVKETVELLGGIDIVLANAVCFQDVMMGVVAD